MTPQTSSPMTPQTSSQRISTNSFNEIPFDIIRKISSFTDCIHNLSIVNKNLKRCFSEENIKIYNGLETVFVDKKWKIYIGLRTRRMIYQKMYNTMDFQSLFLEELELKSVTLSTNIVKSFFQNFPNMKKLSLIHTKKIDEKEEEIKIFESLPHLTNLRYDCDFPFNFTGQNNLKQLSFCHWSSDSNFDDDVFTIANNCNEKITHLTLVTNHIRQENYSKIADSFPYLEELYIHSLLVLKFPLKQFKNTSLKKFSVNGNQIDKGEMNEFIQNNKYLEALELYTCSLTFQDVNFRGKLKVVY